MAWISQPRPQRLSFWSPSVSTLRRLVLAATVIAVLPVGAMAASPDASNGTTTATTAAAPTHHKKPVHHVSHKTHKPKPTSTPTQS